MTGFGTAKGLVGNLTVTVELRSLNSKFLELNLRLPSTFRDKELELRAELNKLLERGKADVSIMIENNESVKRSVINKDVFAAYFQDFKSITDELSVDINSLLPAILSLPSVINTERPEIDTEHFEQLKDLMNQAIARFNSFRIAEGKSLEIDILQRVHAILNAVPILENLEQSRMDSIRNRINKGLQEIKDQTTVDQNRFEQELIYYIEKFDITEEKVRLKSHCNYFLETIASTETNGKKLSFITQEIGREINTIGAKANEALMQRTVVEMKDELEKLKEQLANVL
jgi:uncharacterized protein (TIGR00255 family)